MTEPQRERLADAIRAEMSKQGMAQKELAKKAGTSSGQLCNALNGNGSMSPTKWQMACEALGLDYAEIMAHQVHKGGMPGGAGPDSSLYTGEPERGGVATDECNATKPAVQVPAGVYVPAGPDRSAPVLEEALAEREKTIAQMEAALKGAAEENRELWHENKKLREERKQIVAKGIRLKTELDALKESQSEMIRQAELRLAEEYREAQSQALMKLKAYFFDKEHPDLNL